VNRRQRDPRFPIPVACPFPPPPVGLLNNVHNLHNATEAILDRNSFGGNMLHPKKLPK
jgi:hypothetical protein